MSNILVVIDEMYPFGKDEPFLETEANYFAHFDKVLIIPCSVSDYSKVRPLPNLNIDVLRKHKQYGKLLEKLIKMFRYVKAVITPITFSEILMLIKTKRFTLKSLKSLLSYVSVGEFNLRIALKWLKTYNFDETDKILFYSYWMHIHSYVAIKLKERYQNSKAISRCHGFDLYEYIHDGNYIPLRKWTIKHLDAIFLISEDGKRYLENKYNEALKKVKISYLGTSDNGIFRITDSRRPFKIISCSWMLPVKRIKKIIDTLSTVKEFNIYWTHIGDGELFEELSTYAKQRLPANIEYDFKGALTNSQVLRLYKNTEFHVFINVSESEGIPVSIMEAISYGIPVIATNVGGVNEIVKNGFNGYLLDKDFTDDDLKQRITEVYNMDDTEYQIFRCNARSHWENNFNQEKNYRSFIADIINL